MELVDIVGWIGSLAFAICGAPQAYQCWKQKHADGISAAFLALWVIGEVCSLIFVVLTIHPLSYPLVMNYALNLFFTLVMVRFKLRRKFVGSIP